MTAPVGRLALAALLLLAQAPRAAHPADADEVRAAVDWLGATAARLVREAARPMDDGTTAFPPQVGTGYEAFWLRDYAYVLEGASDALTDEELSAACRLFLRSLRADGAGVDCVRFDGTPVYMPGYGTMGAHPVADGGPFTVAVVWLTLRRTRDEALLAEALAPLARALEATPRDAETRLEHIDPTPEWDRCPYGFTDTVRKQGDVLFSSLLWIEAARRLADLLRTAGRTPDAAHWESEADVVAVAVRRDLWDPAAGLFRAATVRCREHDVWGSAFAVALDVATPAQADAIAARFVRDHAGLVQAGQVRHLPPDETWEQACAPGTYQNGGHWATPAGWFVLALDRADPELANRTLLALVADVRESGACEWIRGDVRRLPGYLASATLPLAGFRALLERRGRR